MEWLSLYGLFLAKVATVMIAIGALMVLVVGLRQRKSGRGELRIIDLSEQYQEIQNAMRVSLMDENALKAWDKQKKKQDNAEAKQRKLKVKAGESVDDKPCLYVLDFKGSTDAHEVSSLREEISAILSVTKQHDEVFIRLESPGGMVHGYGLAASQLQRFRQAGIPLTAAVDKVAASGGYMMACVADRIIAAPFAIIGSIGVVAQLPNFNRWLKKNEVDVELHTAGEFKRTLTLFGENTEQGREKFREELNETHQLFKQFVHQQRPVLDIDSVATGEHWYGVQAQEKGLVDEIGTSDDVLIAKMDQFKVLSVRYIRRKKIADRLTGGVMNGIDNLLLRWWQRGQQRSGI